MAQKINSACGGPVIAPWETNELPEEWHLVFRGLADAMPGLQKMDDQVEKYLAEKRKEAGYR